MNVVVLLRVSEMHHRNSDSTHFAKVPFCLIDPTESVVVFEDIVLDPISFSPLI